MNNTYIEIKTNKDIFKDIKNTKLLQKIAYNYILNGNQNFETIIDVIDQEEIKFIRISAKEYVHGINSHKLNHTEYKQKMRMAPSIDDLIYYSSIRYTSPLQHNSKLFKEGFNNYQGNVKIDNTLFRYIVRVGKTKNDNIFYDLSLENLDIEKGTESEYLV